jgi:putative ABC transport system permease protein
MALGARRSDVVGRVVREGMTTALGGALLGSVGAYVVAQAMRGVLPRLGEPSATAFVLIAVTLLASALVACLVPAWRAASIDPMVALRQE